MSREYKPALQTSKLSQIGEVLHEYVNGGQVTKIASDSRRSQRYCVTLAASCEEHDILTIRKVLQNSGFKTAIYVKPKRSVHYVLKRGTVVTQRNLVSQEQKVLLVLKRVNAPDLPEGIKPFPPPGGKPIPGQQEPAETNGDKEKGRKRGKKRRR